MDDPLEIDEVLFEAAAGIDSAGTRRAFFDLIRQGDPAKAERLSGLLAVHVEADRFFRQAEGARTVVATEAGEELIGGADPAALRAHAPATEPERPGERIGRYRLEKRIGEGGCGVVYLAEQQEPVRRMVALKVIRLGMDTERVIARFEMERQSLALMDHPNIARVLDGGATETGRPFFVMEWVRGLRITDYCDEMRLTVRERIDLFIEVCKGIQHAHQKGVIHRDIKPSNILVSDDDGKATPKVIDFGIAKAMSGGSPGDSVLTALDQFVGTPAYMSPEQVDRKDQDVDTRSDVYSLGILLYELLVGRTPYDSKALAEAGLSELRRILIESEPSPPAAALAAMPPDESRETAARRNTEPGKLAAALKGDLNSVLMKAIEKDRGLRYETVNGFVMDLQRHIAHEPVFARPRKRMYLVRKFIRRNRLGVGAAAAIVLSLLLGMGAAFTYYLRERAAREEQAHLRRLSEDALASELKQFEEARGWEGLAHVSLLLSEGKTQEADERLRKTPLSSIQLSPQSSSLLRSLGNWNSLRGRWDQAVDCFKILLAADEMNHEVHLANSLDLVAMGCAFLEGGKPGEFDAFRTWAVRRFEKDGTMLDISRLYHAVLLVPADRDSLARMDRMKPALEHSEFDPTKIEIGWDKEAAMWRAFGLALLEYRQDRFEKARHWAEVGLRFPPRRDYIWAALEPVHAMAAHRSGDSKTARESLAAARKRIDKAFSPDLAAAYEPLGQDQGFWWDWIIARILFREAEALIDGGNAAAK